MNTNQKIAPADWRDFVMQDGRRLLDHTTEELLAVWSAARVAHLSFRTSDWGLGEPLNMLMESRMALYILMCTSPEAFASMDPGHRALIEKLEATPDADLIAGSA